ncbi:MAG TPA: putative glycolipid-binding domain-containing protein [Candidatus Limnocylindrales bacterium]
MTSRRVSWQRVDETPTDEVCAMLVRDSGLSLVGTVLGADAGIPLRIEYRVLTDAAGLTTAAHVREQRGFGQHALTLVRDTKGGWTGDGAALRELRGCTDIDLGFSPSTLTLPVRRLRLPIGASATVNVAWIRNPGLAVEKVAQTYTRLDEFTYRRASGSIEADLTVDDDGLVITSGAWRRTGLAVGIDDSEPLDAR